LQLSFPLTHLTQKSFFYRSLTLQQVSDLLLLQVKVYYYLRLLSQPTTTNNKHDYTANMKVTSTVVAVLALGTSVMTSPEPKVKNWKNTLSRCGFPGMTCAKTKRAAEAVADALAAAEPRMKSPMTLCGYPGITCAKARRSIGDVADQLESTLNVVFARNADAIAEARIKSPLTLCGYPGVNCAKNKRDAEPHIKSPLTRCGYPGITCAKAKRGLDLIKEDDPNAFKDECFQEGNECRTILKAAGAFHEALKREAEAEPKVKNWRNTLSRCGFPGMTCARDVHDYAIAAAEGSPEAAQAEKDCHGPDGDCTIVQRSLDELEAVLNKAVEDVSRLD
jgi:hypothetical protein